VWGSSFYTIQSMITTVHHLVVRNSFLNVFIIKKQTTIIMEKELEEKLESIIKKLDDAIASVKQTLANVKKV
jgi:hypothetical protein